MARPHYLDDAVDGRQSKKPRFDARNPSTLAPEEVSEEDAILELDEIGKGGLQSKRNAVRLEGYDSDSSNENFDARADAKAQETAKANKKAPDEEDMDMFADLEEEQFNDADQDEDLGREGKKAKKAVRFMENKEIEGQESSSKGGGHVSADFTLNEKQIQRDTGSDGGSSEDDSGAEEERDRLADGMDKELGAGSKKHHAPRLDAFNMKTENEEGRFDQSGNFVRNARDPDAMHDSWLEGSTKADMRKAKAAAEKRELERRKRNRQDDAIPISDTLSALISRMRPEETVLEALQRLGTFKQKKKPTWQKNKRTKAAQPDVDMRTEDEDAEETARKESVEAISAAADRLLSSGQNDIYDQERAMLQRQYSRATGEDWVDPDRERQAAGQGKQWEYRWSDQRDGGDTHGPYDAETMAAWSDAGYFGEGVEFREIGGEGWQHSVDFE